MVDLLGPLDPLVRRTAGQGGQGRQDVYRGPR